MLKMHSHSCYNTGNGSGRSRILFLYLDLTRADDHTDPPRPAPSSQAKIAVKAQSTAEILELQRRARGLDLCAQVISDAGRTQIAAGSKTVLGIGP